MAWKLRAVFVVVAAVLVGVLAPTPAVTQVSLEDVVVRTVDVTADLRPVAFTPICQREPGLGFPLTCRIDRFGTLKGRTVAQIEVTGPTPVSMMRFFTIMDVRSVTGVDGVIPRRDGPYLVLVFNPALAPGSTHTLTFDYEGETAPLWDSFVFVGDGDLYPVLVSPFGDLAANRARTKVTVTAPADYQLASTGTAARTPGGAVQTIRWEPPEPLPYLAVVGGKGFNTLERQAGGVNLTLLVRPGVDRFADQIADFTRRSAEFYGALMYAFPYDRINVVSAPFGRFLLGIGYPGLMMLTDEAFVGRETLLQRDSFRLLLVAHEAAHTYFPAQTSGKGIGLIWLSEGFAEYLGMMTVEAVLGRQAFRTEMDTDRAVYAAVAGRDRPIAQYTFINVNTADGVAVRYAKGAFVLHMLRFVVGDETFRKIMQTYATRFRGQSVRVDNFVEVSQEVSGRDLSWFFQQWVYERVLPDYVIGQVSAASAEGGFRTTAVVRNQGTGRMPVDVLFEADGGERVVVRVDVPSRGEATAVATTRGAVRRVEADPEKWMLQTNYQNDAATVR